MDQNVVAKSKPRYAHGDHRATMFEPLYRWESWRDEAPLYVWAVRAFLRECEDFGTVCQVRVERERCPACKGKPWLMVSYTTEALRDRRERDGKQPCGMWCPRCRFSGASSRDVWTRTKGNIR